MKEIRHVLDPHKEPWILDHCPTYTRPSLPMMSWLCWLQEAFDGYEGAIRLHGGMVVGWLLCDKPCEYRLSFESIETSRAKVWGACQGKRVFLGGECEWGAELELDDFPVLEGLLGYENRYLSYFHGKAFQVASHWKQGPQGGVHVVHGNAISKHVTMDALLHGIPHTTLYQWAKEVPVNGVAYPVMIESCWMQLPLDFSIDWEVRTRLLSYDNEKKTARLRIQARAQEQVLIDLCLVEKLVDLGLWSQIPQYCIPAFTRGEVYLPGLWITTPYGSGRGIEKKAWGKLGFFPHLLKDIYGIPATSKNQMQQVLAKEYMAARCGVGFNSVSFSEDEGLADYASGSCALQFYEEAGWYVVTEQ